MKKTNKKARPIPVLSSLLAVFLLLFSCAHQPEPRPAAESGVDVSMDWGKHLISGARPFEWWYFDGHPDTGETFFARPMYCRAIAGFEGEIVEDGVPHSISGECLYEVMNFE